MIEIGFKKLSDKAVIPNKKFPTDAGYDVYAVEEVEIPAKAQAIIKTDVQLAECHPDIVLQVWSRSGLDSKFGLHVGAGIIDSSYRGEILICLKNMSTVAYTVKVGDKIAQLVPIHLPKVLVKEVIDVQETERMAQGGIAEAEIEYELLEDEP
jgi:dUTP pyrophosphatase